MRRALGLAGAVLTVALVACGSGPNQEALDRNQIPTTTTTTEPPPEGIFVVVIENGKITIEEVEKMSVKERLGFWKPEDDDDRAE